MVFKQYRRAKYVGDWVLGYEGILEPGKSYGGTWLVFDDSVYGPGAVLFHVTRGLTGQSDKWDWEFKDKYAV